MTCSFTSPRRTFGILGDQTSSRLDEGDNLDTSGSMRRMLNGLRQGLGRGGAGGIEGS